ncbi:ABC transporter substrate-binding protein [Nocardia beijingensis]|uniref:ABC transporter substrate-binding protein n=1 Tax=Nocardia beijingensis TaxID=95162 RepID=UPI003A5CCA5E
MAELCRQQGHSGHRRTAGRCPVHHRSELLHLRNYAAGADAGRSRPRQAGGREETRRLLAGLGFASEKVAIAAPNYIAPCLAFKEKGVDAVFPGVSVEAISRIAASCAQQGYKPIQAPTGVSLQKAWATDPNFEGSIFAGSNALYTDESIPAIKDFNDALAEYIPGLRDSTDFSSPLLWPWAGGQLFLAAAKAVGLSPSSTSADVIKGCAHCATRPSAASLRR